MDESNSSKCMDPQPDRWAGFGWAVREIDGHDMQAICDALDWAESIPDQPTVIIANTVKGKGVSFIEDQAAFHNGAMSPEQYELALAELEAQRDALAGRRSPEMPATLETRFAYGEALLELGAQRPDVVALDADLYKSTRIGPVPRRLPESLHRHRHLRSGHGQHGRRHGRVRADPLRQQLCHVPHRHLLYADPHPDRLPRLNVKLIGSSAGLTQGPDGASHQSLEDIALMRGLPNMTVIVPADDVETRQATFAIADWPGPVYMRLGRYPVPRV